MRIILVTLLFLTTFSVFAQQTYIPRMAKDDFFNGETDLSNIPDSLLVSTEDEYILRKGDRISIYVMDHLEFSKPQIMILPDGSIEYPLIGTLRVAGLNSAQLRAIIEERLRPYVTIPIVTIYIEKIFGEKLNIIGYVNGPGEYQLYEPIRITDAIAMAKGIINIREVKTIRVIRKDGDVFNVSLKHIWFNDDDETNYRENLLLNPGDTLIVPPPRRFNWRMYTAIIATLSLILQIYIATN